MRGRSLHDFLPRLFLVADVGIRIARVRRDPLQRLSIRAALALGFGLVLSLWGLTGYVLSVRIARTETQMTEITGRYVQAQDVLSAVRQHVNQSSILLRDALLNPGDDDAQRRYRRRIDESYAAIAAQLDGYRPVRDDHDAEHLARLRAEITAYRAVTLEVLDEAQATPTRRPSTLLDLYVVPRRAAAIGLSDELRALNRRALIEHQAATTAVHRAAERQWWYGLGAALVATVAIALIAIVYAGRLEDRLRRGRDREARHAAELQHLSSRLVQAQEEERRNIARELHDEVGQVLSAIAVEAQRAEIALERPPDAGRALAEVQQLTDGALRTVRDLSQLLRPAMLDDLGLAAAVDWLLRGFARRHAVQVEVVQRGMAARLPAEVEVAAFRIVQEAVTNVARHAGATRCTVRLAAESARLLVEVEDDGVGFDPDVETGAEQRPGLGLVGMRERAAGLGGSVIVDSGPGRGTRVSVSLPLSGRAADDTGLQPVSSVGLATA